MSVSSCDFAHEQELWSQGLGRIAGVDEAGRGCLAGPVVAAAVILPKDFISHFEHQGVRDSKKLSPKRRELLAQFFAHEPSIQIGIGEASSQEIDELNILVATHLAMARALEALPVKPEHALVDGLPVKGLACPHTALVKGDGRSLSIAAASIVAKAHRDELMSELDKLYPNYGFAQHKGYGTKLHLLKLQQHGSCKEHRQSFAPVQAVS